MKGNIFNTAVTFVSFVTMAWIGIRLSSTSSNIHQNQKNGKLSSSLSGLRGVHPSTNDYRRLQEQMPQQEQQEENSGRPIIYTFYSPIILDGTSVIKGTGMTEEADQALLQAWKQAWSESGWDPRVLSLQDAKKHHKFNTLNYMLNDLPFGYYDRLCFLRWLAMAAVGGGWLVDYDTFPLHKFGPELPNGGRFTVHEGSKEGGVPSLASGSAEEWSRLGERLIQNAVQHKPSSHWSDMRAMQDLYQGSDGQSYVMEWNVIPGLSVLHGRGADPETCDGTRNRYAVHFSHYSIDHGVTKKNAGPADRPIIAMEWLAEYRNKCFNAFRNEDEPANPQQPQEAAEQQQQVEPPQPQPQPSPQAPQPEKPAIYTFFSPDPNDANMAGMSPQANVALIQAWAQAWASNGFNPVVLSIENAMNHPDYQEMNRIMDGLPFGYYDRLCFLRWLAMATVGGGWLVDYDTFPLHKFESLPLPNEGMLTVHEYSKSGGVPSMVSGTPEEWYRLAKAHVENAKAHSGESHWSDMKALNDLFQTSDGAFYQVDDSVVPAFTLLRRSQDVDQEICEITRDKRAAHFSHYAVHISKTRKEGAGPEDRAEIASTWVAEWRSICNWTEVIVPAGRN